MQRGRHKYIRHIGGGGVPAVSFRTVIVDMWYLAMFKCESIGSAINKRTRDYMVHIPQYIVQSFCN